MRYALELRLNPLEGALQGPQVGLPRLCGSRCGGDGSRCGGQKRTSVVGMSVWMGADGEGGGSGIGEAEQRECSIREYGTAH